jgi:hypothetical protein
MGVRFVEGTECRGGEDTEGFDRMGWERRS